METRSRLPFCRSRVGASVLGSTGSLRQLAALAGLSVVWLLAALALPSAAEAAIPNIPNGAGGNITCTVQTGANAGQRHCSGIFTTFDGAPIDVNIGFPPAPASGPDGDFPIVGGFHGWGGSKLGFTSGGWINSGYAFFSMSDRGWGQSCGALDPKRSQPVCQNGYNHLMDTRFEVRDAQEIFEALADRAADGATAGEGLIDSQAIGVTGGSYGGGLSMALGALKNRKMIEAGDGTLVPWVSDGGKPMQIAAAQPDIPWTDLAYSLLPNGHTLDYVKDAPYLQRGRIGVMKQSWVALLYASGQALSNYAPAGTDPDADLISWYAAINAGEPYDQNPLAQDIADEVTTHHSSYYIDDSTAPAPMLISNGFTDDLFPPDEAIRFYNRTRANHPGTPISLLFTDHGHARGQNKGPDASFRSAQLHNWFDHYVKGVGPQPFQGVQTLTQTCGTASGGATGPFDDANTDLPFRASSWAEMAPGEVRFNAADAKTIAPEVSDQAGTTFDPNGGGGACATAPGADQAGTASYRLDPAPAGGFTLMGSPTIVADVLSQGPTSQVAARLLDIDPASGNERLVARGLYRPEINSGGSPTRQVWQLHPNGWRFESGHIAKLELLPADQPYGRDSNGQLPVMVSNLELRLPVLEQPGGSGGLVQDPAPKVVPDGYELAPDYLTGYPRPLGAAALRVPLAIAYEQCDAGSASRVHGPGLEQPSCNPATQESDWLTVGTPDANSRAVQSNGSVQVTTCPNGTTASGACSTPAGMSVPDVRLAASLSDVRCVVGAAAQGSCQGGSLSDYTGQLAVVLELRITDKHNSSTAGGTGDAATVSDLPFRFPVACEANPAGGSADAAGGSCGVLTSANAVTPGAVSAGKRAIWELGQIEVLDGGADGSLATADSTVFARQGVFVP